jgi:hypothetical protein
VDGNTQPDKTGALNLMTIEEQLHNVVHLLEATASLALRNEETCKRLFEVAEVHSRSLRTLAETIEISHNKLAEALGTLTEQVAAHVVESRAYVADSRERMKQMEANLDALIRIITAEHSNGKGKL